MKIHSKSTQLHSKQIKSNCISENLNWCHSGGKNIHACETKLKSICVTTSKEKRLGDFHTSVAPESHWSVWPNCREMISQQLLFQLQFGATYKLAVLDHYSLACDFDTVMTSSLLCQEWCFRWSDSVEWACKSYCLHKRLVLLHTQHLHHLHTNIIKLLWPWLLFKRSLCVWGLFLFSSKIIFSRVNVSSGTKCFQRLAEYVINFW